MTVQKNLVLTLVYCLVASFSLYAQSTATPQQLEASDGTYEKYVMIRWEVMPVEHSFKVYRSTSPSADALHVISQEWQKSPMLYDYGVLPGVEYYYRVVAKKGEQVSEYSLADLGYIKAGKAIAANLIPGTYLEPLVNSLRSDNYNFTVTSPQADTLFTIPTDSTFLFKGQLDVDDLNSDSGFILSIFSNEDAAYENNMPMVSQPLALDNDFSFETILPVPQASGLYYIVVSLQDDEEPVFVERFRVE